MKPKVKKPKPLDLVKLREERKKDYTRMMFNADARFVYLGDINQVPGHGIFIELGTDRVLAGFDTGDFERVEDDEV